MVNIKVLNCQSTLLRLSIAMWHMIIFCIFFHTFVDVFQFILYFVSVGFSHNCLDCNCFAADK